MTIDQDLETRKEAIAKSVVAPQTDVVPNPGVNEAIGLSGPSALFFMASKGDGMTPWGFNPTTRDKQLRALYTSEPYSFSALATVVATNMGLGYELTGPDSAVARVQDMLHAAQFGEGWEAWTARTGWDFYGQDKGSVSELVRTEDDPRAEVIGLNQLEIVRSWHTGNPEIPVLYQDRLGRWHGLKWYNCIRLSEMPAPHELLYGLQYSAATRILNITKIIRNMLMLMEEKTGGRHTRTVYIVSGIKKGDIENAMKIAQAAAEAEGMLRYIQPVIVPTLAPDQEAKLTEIALASLPDGFSENMDVYMKWFLVAIAMGLLRDYQDFAPLPGGGLGSSHQSEVLDRKSRGKGPAIWQRRVSHAFNFNGVMPRNVEFAYADKDIEEEKARADLFNVFAEGYSKLLSSFVLDPMAVRQLMVDNGMIPQELYDALNERDITGQSPLSDNDRLRQALAVERRTLQSVPTAVQDSNPQNPAPAGRGGAAQDGSVPQNPNGGRTQTGERDMTIEVTDDRLEVEGRLSAAGEQALAAMGKEVARKLRSTVHAGVDVPGA